MTGMDTISLGNGSTLSVFTLDLQSNSWFWRELSDFFFWSSEFLKKTLETLQFLWFFRLHITDMVIVMRVTAVILVFTNTVLNLLSFQVLQNCECESYSNVSILRD